MSPEKVIDTDALSPKNKNHNVMDFCMQSSPVHSYLFGSEFLAVDSNGKVTILSVPVFPLKGAQNSYNLKTLCEEHKERSEPIVSVPQSETNVQPIFKSNSVQEEKLEQVKTIPETPLLNKTLVKEEDSLDIKAPSLLLDECEMSPRLTNMIQSGIVPESPVHDVGKFLQQNSVIISLMFSNFLELLAYSCN